MAVDPRNFLFSSDYPMDKVVYLHSGVLNFAVSGTDYIVAHGLSFTPLIKVVWSTDANFTTTYGVGDGPVSTVATAPFLPQLTRGYAGTTNVTLSFGNPGAVTHAYIRIYAFMPSNVNVDTPGTASSADTFSLNTDYNYSKLYLEGATASSSTPSSTVVVSHGLGYYPQTELWFEISGNIEVLTQTLLISGAPQLESATLSTSSITFTRNTVLPSAESFHYRIYRDELA